jgi:hypothetical protein
MDNLELYSMRYLINNLIFSQYEINRKLDILLEREGKELKKVPRPRPKSLENDIGFDMFALSEQQYQKLIDRYGVDLTSKCCVALDHFIKTNGYMPYKNPLESITKVIAVNVMKEEIDKHKKELDDLPIYDYDINHEDIENKEDARMFIKSIPAHIRNIDSRVKYLVDKFNLKELKEDE